MFFGTRIHNFHMFFSKKSQDFHMFFGTRKWDFHMFFGTTSQDFHMFFGQDPKAKKNICVGAAAVTTVTRAGAAARSRSQKKYLRLRNTLCVVRLEAVSVERNLTLLAHVDRLQASLPLEVAHLAVVPLGLAGGILLCAHNPVAP
jgi:hypothetical protein